MARISAAFNALDVNRHLQNKNHRSFSVTSHPRPKRRPSSTCKSSETRRNNSNYVDLAALDDLHGVRSQNLYNINTIQTMLECERRQAISYMHIAIALIRTRVSFIFNYFGWEYIITTYLHTIINNPSNLQLPKFV